MFLGALLDAGLPLDALRDALGSLCDRPCRVDARKVMRAGVSATQLVIDETVAPLSAAVAVQTHSHSHAHLHEHRSLAEIEAMIAASALSPAGRARAVALFRRLAETEAAIHAMPIDQVHLHEVGDLDSIVDIVGGVFAMEWFGASQVLASSLNVGSGTVHCAHGRFPCRRRPPRACSRACRSIRRARRSS